jgi:hypothetical protein
MFIEYQIIDFAEIFTGRVLNFVAGQYIHGEND